MIIGGNTYPCIEDFAGGHCPYLDQCVFSHMDTDDVFEWLKEDFLRYYSTNKAPYNLAMKTNWFTTKTQVNKGRITKRLQWFQTLILVVLLGVQ